MKIVVVKNGVTANGKHMPIGKQMTVTNDRAKELIGLGLAKEYRELKGKIRHDNKLKINLNEY